MLTYGSLFAGYGGLEMGVASVLPGELAWYAEYEPPSKQYPRPTQAAARVMAHHHPSVPNLGDVTAVDWSTVPRVDVLTGGFPCTDISTAGRMAGLIRSGADRTRSGLWAEMRTAIEALRPPLVVIENVRGLTYAPADSDVEPCSWCLGDDGDGPALRALGAVLGDLADIGYDAAWYGLRAADVGAAHGRFRIFIFAWPTDAAGDTWRVLHGDGGAAADAQGDEQREPLIGVGQRSEPHGGAADALTLLPTPDAYQGTRGGSQDPSKRREGGHSVTLQDVAAELDSLVTLLPTPRKSDRWGVYAAAIARHEAVIGRSAPAPTKTGRNGKPRLAPVFVEYLMMLPRGHVTDCGITDNEALRVLGNGVVPPQAAAVTRQIAADFAALMSGAVA